MNNHSKIKCEQKEAERATRRESVMHRKQELRERLKASHSKPLTAMQRILLVLDLIWHILGGAIVAITGWSPFKGWRR